MFNKRSSHITKLQEALKLLEDSPVYSNIDELNELKNNLEFVLKDLELEEKQEVEEALNERDLGREIAEAQAEKAEWIRDCLREDGISI